MKNLISTRLFLLLCCTMLLAAMQMQAQNIQIQNDPDPYPVPDTNGYAGAFNPRNQLQGYTSPLAQNTSVIFYDNAATAYIAVAGWKTSDGALQLVRTSADGGSTMVQPVNNGVLLNNLIVNQVYELRGKDSRGVWTTLSVINTYPFKPGEDQIVVSNNLYRALSQYVAADGQQTPLDAYIGGLTTANIYEKTAFAQKYFLRGAALPGSLKDTYPLSFIRAKINDRTVDPGCNCEFIVNQSPLAIPDNVANNKEIEDWVTSDQGDFGNASKWWLNTSAEGPAKVHKLNSDGWKDGMPIYSKTVSYAPKTLQDSKSPFYARLSYHMLCVNFPDALPADCACTKQVKVNFGYNSEVKAKATVRSSPGLRRSSAMAQDYAVAFVTRENVNALNDIQILDAGMADAKAACSAGVPASVFVDGAQIVFGVVKVVKGIKTGNFNDVSAEVDVLADQITSLLNKVTEEKECDQASVYSALLQGTSTITIDANNPTSVMLVSGSELFTSGKRSWDSEASVSSSFFLAGVLEGSQPSGEANYCCSDYAATWAWAGQPNDDSNLQAQVANFIFMNFPNNAPLFINGVPGIPGHIVTATELGHATADFQGCEKEIPIINPR